MVISLTSDTYGSDIDFSIESGMYAISIQYMVFDWHHNKIIVASYTIDNWN